MNRASSVNSLTSASGFFLRNPLSSYKNNLIFKKNLIQHISNTGEKGANG